MDVYVVRKFHQQKLFLSKIILAFVLFSCMAFFTFNSITNERKVKFAYHYVNMGKG